LINNLISVQMPCAIVNNLARSEPDDSPSDPFHKGCPTRIGFDSIVVMLSVDLDDEPVRKAGEIGKIRIDRMLAAKLDAFHAVRTDQLPENPLCWTGVAAQFPCSLRPPGHGPLS
jgi:hypothetical protein